ncbi:MAG: YfcE family phosphodiesterase [Planctomycetes bacterium]|nr:YfcE family phosphodiesterase [Planctomycetota bacterium]
MRILVVTDIHGNRAALEAIREPFDVCLCLGDIVDYGPEPGACIEWVRANATHTVRGNHDHGVAQNVTVQGAAGFRYLTAVTRPLTIQSLTPEQRRFLADLPTSRMLTLGGKRFLLVHASPRDPMDEYTLAEATQWAPLLQGLYVDFVLVGHTHQLYSLDVNGITVVNPGSVGLTRNGDPRAAYAVIENGKVELKRVEYPVEETIAALEGFVSDPHARQLLTDIYQGRGLVGRWAVGKTADADDSSTEPTG